MDLSRQFTVAADVRTGKDAGCVFSKGASARRPSGPRALSLHVAAGAPCWRSGASSVSPTSVVSDGCGTDVGAADAAAGTMRLFVDGRLEGEVELAELSTAKDGEIDIGKWADPRGAEVKVGHASTHESAPASFFEGEIREPRLFCRALALSEVRGFPPVALLPGSLPGDAVALDDGGSPPLPSDVAADFDMDFSLTCELRTTEGGPVLAKCGGPGFAQGAGKWRKGMKCLFVVTNPKAFGTVAWNVGRVGLVHGRTNVCDGPWHSVAVTHSKTDEEFVIYVDGREDARRAVASVPDGDGWTLRIGSAAENFPRPRSRFAGDIRGLRYFSALPRGRGGEAAAQSVRARVLTRPRARGPRGGGADANGLAAAGLAAAATAEASGGHRRRRRRRFFGACERPPGTEEHRRRRKETRRKVALRRGRRSRRARKHAREGPLAAAAGRGGQGPGRKARGGAARASLAGGRDQL